MLYPGFASAQEPADAELESCFKYYDYGKVKVNLASDKANYKTGENAEVRGTIRNLNSFPIRNAILYAQLKRINQDNDFGQNGHYLTDRITFIKNFNLSPSEDKQIKLNLAISESYPGGDYQLQYFVFSDAGFNFAGRNFLEEDNAGTTSFSIVNPERSLIYYDPNSIYVNGERHSIRETLSILPNKETSLSVNLAGANDADEYKAEYYIFDFDDALPGNLIERGERVLNSDNNFRLNVSFNPDSSGAYVFQVITRQPVKTMIKYRFVIEGDDPAYLRMNDLGITNYPPSVEDRAYMCFHSVGDSESAEYTLRLSVLNNEDKMVEQKSVEGKFDASVRAVSVPLNNLADPGRFKIRGEIVSDALPAKDRFVEITYTCSDFGESVRDMDVVFNGNRPNILTVEGRNGCGEVGRAGGAVDSVRVFRNGILVKEDYNSELKDGTYNLPELPGGEYSVEVKRGDQVKALSINVPKKTGFVFFKVIAIIIFSSGFTYIFLLRKKKRK